jgi:hypothetical protein
VPFQACRNEKRKRKSAPIYETRQCEAHLDETKGTKLMSLEQAFTAEHLSAEAVATPVAHRLAAGAGWFLAQEPLTSNEHAEVLVVIIFHPMLKIIVLA